MNNLKRIVGPACHFLYSAHLANREVTLNEFETRFPKSEHAEMWAQIDNFMAVHEGVVKMNSYARWIAA